MSKFAKNRNSKFLGDRKSANLMYQRGRGSRGRRVIGTGGDVGTVVATDKGIAIDRVGGLVLGEGSGGVGL